jgi:hypothetical protein
MEFGWSRKRPTLDSIALNQFRDLFGKFSVDATMVFGLELGALGNRIHVAPAYRIAYRKSASHVRDFVCHAAMSISNVERLNQGQTWTSGRRFIYSIGFQTSAVGNDDK